MPASLAWRAGRKILPPSHHEKLATLNLHRRFHKILSRLKPDVINVHNLHSALPLGWRSTLLEVCSYHAPTVWTLHDMWSFTGRCTYSYECRKFLSGCDDRCPTPQEYPVLEPEKIRDAWEEQQRILRLVPDLVAVTPSSWLAAEAQNGFWKQHRVEVIPNGLPLDVFAPRDRSEARRKLDLPSSGPVLLMVGLDLSERRKGGSILIQCLEGLSEPVTLLTLGKNELFRTGSQVTVRRMGFSDNENKTALLYNASSFLVHPSLADNLPNVVVESIACGTPVVAFRTGGVPEIVRPGITGFLADEISADAFRATLQSAIHSSTDLGSSCRNVAVNEYSDSLQARRYLALFSELKANKKLA